MQRQKNAKARSFAGSTRDIDVAAVSSDDFVTDRQSQPSAFSHRLSGEERIENSTQILGIDTAARVGDFNQDFLALQPAGDTDLIPLFSPGCLDRLERVHQ